MSGESEFVTVPSRISSSCDPALILKMLVISSVTPASSNDASRSSFHFRKFYGQCLLLHRMVCILELGVMQTKDYSLMTSKQSFAHQPDCSHALLNVVERSSLQQRSSPIASGQIEFSSALIAMKNSIFFLPRVLSPTLLHLQSQISLSSC